jgi:hypothetical protein
LGGGPTGDSRSRLITGTASHTLPILDTLQKMTNSLLVNVDIPIDTKRLVRISLYPCKIDLAIWFMDVNMVIPPSRKRLSIMDYSIMDYSIIDLQCEAPQLCLLV